MRNLKNILVTGGAGFIGTNFIRYLFNQNSFEGRIVNIDKLTYAGNLENLREIEEKYELKRYFFEHEDICNTENLKKIFVKYKIDTVVHFAAESHVDRSIYGPKDFIQTNIFGTFSLLEVVRELWKDREDVLFHHVSTDEVFGSLGPEGFFDVESKYDPRSPYAASKASSDHLVRAYQHTYGIPVTISNCSNNYGPYQFPEKLVPLMILNMLEEKPLPIYGDGSNIRDWLFVDDHSSALYMIIKKGKNGITYTISGENEYENIKLVHLLCEKMSAMMGKQNDYYKKYIKFVEDRPGHDQRYAMKCRRLKEDLGWEKEYSFEQGIEKTINWYLENQQWIKNIRTGEYLSWINKNYTQRAASQKK